MKLVTSKSFIIVFTFLVLTLIKVSPVISQEEKDKNKTVYKNTIKFMPTIVPFTTFEAGLSIGYERHINRQNVLELVAYFIYMNDEMGTSGMLLSLKPGYKHYFRVNRDKGPEFWAGAYFSYITTIPKNDVNEKCSGSYVFGIGAYVGMRAYLSKKRKWFLDLGYGLSYNRGINYNHYLGTKDISYAFMQRPILQFGLKF